MKKSLKLRAVVSPTPAIIAAAYDENGKADACTLAFYTPSSHTPPCLTIAINATAKRKTLKSILHSGAFTIGYPGVGQAAEADWIGIASGYEHDKIAEVDWTVTRAEKVDAPVINELKLVVECKVVNTVTIGSHVQITGEVVNIQADESILDEHGKYSLEKLKPIIYDEEHWRYLAVGEKAADAFKCGLVFKKKTHGRSWKPLYELFEPLGLLPIDAKCNGEKRDALYALSKTAIGRIELYLPVMKRLAKAIKKKSADSVEFAKSDYRDSGCWNQLRNFFGNMQKAHIVSVCVKDNGDTLSICPHADRRRFLDGGWAENGMVYLIEKTIKSFSKEKRLASSIFWNVTLSNGASWNSIKYEFDAIAKVGKMFYVFEVKTGSILSIDKWFERWSLFKNAGVRYIQCTAKEIDYRLFLPLQLVPIAHFERLLKECLEKDLIKSKDDKETSQGICET